VSSNPLNSIGEIENFDLTNTYNNPFKGFGKRKTYRLTKFTYESFLQSKSMQAVKKLHLSGGFRKKKSYQTIVRLIRTFRSPLGARKIKRLVKMLNTIYKTNINHHLIVNYIEFMEHLIVNHGYNRAAKVYKELCSYATRYALEHRSTPVTHLKHYGSDKFPVVLKPFRKMLEGTYESRIASLTVLDIHKLYGVGNIIPDVKGIVKEGVLPSEENFNFKPGNFFMKLFGKTGKAIFKEIANRWEELLEAEFPKSKLIERCDKLSLHSTILISSKSGPNGPCIPSSVLDYDGIANSVTKDGLTLLDHVKAMSKLTNNEQLLCLLEQYRENYEKSLQNPFCCTDTTNFTGRLTDKQEHSGKSRWIAIIDFFTQSSLKGMHCYHADWLKDQPGDGTFDQNKSFREIVELSKQIVSEDEILASLDLSEATNRLPVDLSAEIIQKQFGPRYSKIWKILTTDRDFHMPDGKTSVRYEVGQPMGTYTSWTALAITNHLLAKVSELMVFKKAVGSIFFIVGDDFVCKGLKLSAMYTFILISIGVDISELKGYTFRTSFEFERSGLTQKVPNTAEFVKRVCINGVELTPLRPSTIFLGLGDPIDFNQMVDTLYNRGTILSISIIELLCSYTFNPYKAALHCVSPISPCLYIRDLYDNCQYTDNVSEVIDSLTVLFPDFLDFPTGSKLYKAFKSYSWTFNDYLECLHGVLSDFILKKVKPGLKSLRSFVNKDFNKNMEERKSLRISEKMNNKIFSGGLKSLDLIYLMIFLLGKSFLLKCAELLKSSAPSFELVNEVKQYIVSIKDFESIANGSKGIPLKIRESNVLNDILSVFLKNTGKDLIYYHKSNYIETLSVSRILNLSQDDDLKPKSLEEFFPKDLRMSNVERDFFNTREGFLSTLSPPVRQAMINISLTNKDLDLGKRLSSVFAVDNNLKSIILNCDCMTLRANSPEVYSMLDGLEFNIIPDNVGVYSNRNVLDLI
jgi:hypothetical protein